MPMWMIFGSKLTKNCDVVLQWMVENKLMLNIDKTHFMTLGTQRRLNLQEERPLVKLVDYALMKVQPK